MTITDEQIAAISAKTWADAMPADYATLLSAIDERDATIDELKHRHAKRDTADRQAGVRLTAHLQAAYQQQDTISLLREELAELRKPVADVTALLHRLEQAAIANDNAHTEYGCADGGKAAQELLAALEAVALLCRPVVVDSDGPEISDARSYLSYLSALNGVSKSRAFEALTNAVSAYDELARDNARWVNARDCWTGEMEAKIAEVNGWTETYARASAGLAEREEIIERQRRELQGLRALLQEIADKDAAAEEELRILGLAMPAMSEVRKNIAAALAASPAPVESEREYAPEWPIQPAIDPSSPLALPQQLLDIPDFLRAKKESGND